MWPDVILAKSRIDKVKTLTMYEMISITTSNGIITRGTFLGKNIEKNFMLYIFKPKIFSPIKIESDNENVKVIWLVTVKVYGIIPIKLQNNKVIWRVKIKGK